MHRVFAVFILVVTSHSVVRAQEAAEATPPEVIELILRADMEFDVDIRSAVRTVREAQQVATYPEVAHVARIALRYRLRPGAALRLDPNQLQQVIDHNGKGSLYRALGHVFGILGAFAGVGAALLGSLSASLASAFPSSSPGNELIGMMSTLAVCGVVLPLAGVALHDIGGESDEAAKLLLRVVPTTSGASLMFSSRF